jgi:hypothetical protein
MISPQYNLDNLFLVVRFSSVDERFNDDTIYIKWQYRDYNGILFTSGDYIDIQATVEIDKLLSN